MKSILEIVNKYLSKLLTKPTRMYGTRYDVEPLY